MFNFQFTMISILGLLLIIFGIWDGWKYHWLAEAVRKIKTAKGQSRKFINAALGKDIILITYLLFQSKLDWYLIGMTLIGFIFTVELLITVYCYYPYRKRGLIHFKRPNFFLYLINSIVPNRIRKRL